MIKNRGLSPLSPSPIVAIVASRSGAFHRAERLHEGLKIPYESLLAEVF